MTTPATPDRTPGRCYVCGARTRHPSNYTCGWEPCQEEHARRFPHLAVRRTKLAPIRPRHVVAGTARKAYLFDSKLQVQ